ncbi:MAG: DUF1292 domain-containing protein [Parasporobacterium sp.]|nr:DUF1292 domain-containing protein [Parasporobacterium sp.]
MEEGKIIFTNEDGTTEEFYVIEETSINGVNYLMVSEDDLDAEEADVYILKDTSPAGSEEAVYVFVEDDDEINAAADVFAELLEDEDLER